jgi:hypothetical protein
MWTTDMPEAGKKGKEKPRREAPRFTKTFSGQQLFADDRVLGGFGDAEFEHLFGRDFDGFAGGGVAAAAGFALSDDEFAESGDGETDFGFFVGHSDETFENRSDLFFAEFAGFGQGGDDLSFGFGLGSHVCTPEGLREHVRLMEADTLRDHRTVRMFVEEKPLCKMKKWLKAFIFRVRGPNHPF